MRAALEIISAVLDRAGDVLMFPLDPSNRIYWLYLLSSALVAYFVYRSIRAKGEHATERDAEAANGSFLHFLFPRSVWSHPSAWLDLRYVFFHKVVSHFLLAAVWAFALASSYRLVSGGQLLGDLVHQGNKSTLNDWLIAAVYMIVAMLLLDFVAWLLHYLQHKIPLLWQFHKVHHSAEVMHPISNFREHPVDNLVYGFFSGLSYGTLFALSVRWLGFLPSAPSLLGVPIMMFVFNLVGYNLRHSHVWLRWPGIWSVVFPSPAHHHVHHSRHPSHIDKNFAFMFPVWDWIFGTYVMPENNRDVKFGITEEDARDLDGVLKLYWVPFRDAFRILRPQAYSSGAAASAGEIEQEETFPR